MKVKIESVEDYKLYLTKQMPIAYPDVKQSKLDALTGVMVACFMDGIKYNQGNLEVEV